MVILKRYDLILKLLIIIIVEILFKKKCGNIIIILITIFYQKMYTEIRISNYIGNSIAFSSLGSL